MPAVNQFNGFGGTPGFNNWPNMTQTILNTMGKWVANPAATTA